LSGLDELVEKDRR